MKFCSKCCSVDGACGYPYGPYRSPILYGGEGWTVEPWTPGSPAVLGDIIVEITGSTTHGDFSSETGYGPTAGFCCPCMDGEWHLDHQSGSCQWATGYEFFVGVTENGLPPGCEEPYPCFPVIFGGTCPVVNAGFITLYFQTSFDGVNFVFTLSVNNYMQQTGYGYVCAETYTARAEIPAPPEGEAIDITDWTEMFGTDDAPFGGNRYCGWITHSVDEEEFPATVSIRFKAAP